MIEIPRTARAVLRFERRDAVVFGALVRLAELTGMWRYPIAASGDLPEMTRRDMAYWLYKSAKPIRRPVRGSGLEEHFVAPLRCSLPDGFAVDFEIRLSAAGDLMGHPLLASARDTLYEQVRDLIFGVDLAMANLECVLGDHLVGILEVTPRSGPAFVFDLATFDAVRGSFDFLATACNHSLDFGADGVASTIAALNERGIAFHGVNTTEADAGKATILDRGGIRLGLISFTFGLNGKTPPPDRGWIVNRLPLNRSPDAIDFGSVERQLAHCRAEDVDFVIAQLHWGMEFEYYPRPAQLEVARQLAELGVDAIIGHHPHVPQPSELYRTRRDPDRLVPIHYSLGNLTNPFSAPFLCRSHVARIDVAKGRTARGAVATYVRRIAVHELDQRIVDGRLVLVPA